jgi:hypothetical protein
VEELLRADGFRRAGAFLGMGFFFVVFLIALRAAVAEADFFPGLVFPRLDAEAAFVFEARFFTPRAFFVVPARVSTKAVTALDATFIAASTFALAASAIASCADVLNPAFSFSMIASFPDSSRNRHTQRGQCSHQQKLCRICALAYPPATKRGGRRHHLGSTDCSPPSAGRWNYRCRSRIRARNSIFVLPVSGALAKFMSSMATSEARVGSTLRINSPASSIARIAEHGAFDFDLSVGKPTPLDDTSGMPTGQH